MGLDIGAYSHVNVIDGVDEYDEEWEFEDSIHQEFINHHFPHAVPERLHGERYLIWKETDETDSHHFRAGSYSGYGLFRSTLASAFIGTKDLYSDRDDSNGDWARVHAAVNNPFYELINFSDCEGVFYGPVCAKLHRDFVMHRDFYVGWLVTNNPYDAWGQEYFVGRYDDFTKAFDLASHDGVVSFH